ncbi:ubiquitin-conjugating enzyme e2 w [Anaeramoeba ignava]|uniref:Ubiquitin-conjugating enzyme e2 w n=1 Tax=Anaeramoeba ignava TaxID=1746090 RepID=A0A9Q0LTD4_ANAIG|nr:ubiquitin-conjugating enzyme e2 w [Anaeramoeba ignava]
MSLREKRLMSELKSLTQKTPDLIKIVKTENLMTWLIEITGAEKTLYEDETYTLQFRFDTEYPLKPPEVVFLQESPVHPHIYSNGHICLDILDESWTPALTVESVLLSLISMMSSCKKKERPPDDSSYVRAWKKNKFSPKKTKWFFHDNKV